MSQKIEARVLKGFRDALPAGELQRRKFINSVEACFRSFGFLPIDTPALEYADILLGKGGGETEKQIYRFKDNGDRDVALRFDLTVPFARFMAEHVAELGTPFKRYHIAKVWRGENTQKGRYREFFQCDFDCVGSDSALSDFEIMSMMSASLSALGIPGFRVHFSHRGLFNRFLEKRGITGSSPDILRTVDKLAKIGPDAVLAELGTIAGASEAGAILEFVSAGGNNGDILAKLENLAGGECDESLRVKALLDLIEGTGQAERFVLDPSITRGLDYYTGVVFETFLTDIPSIGSVCSGGRYNNLAALYSDVPLSGVGASIGMDRLLAALESLDSESSKLVAADLLILQDERFPATAAFSLATRLRAAGLSVEVFTDRKKPVAQYGYGEKKGIPLALVSGESTEGAFVVRNLAKRENSQPLSFDALVDLVKTGRAGACA